MARQARATRVAARHRRGSPYVVVGRNTGEPVASHRVSPRPGPGDVQSIRFALLPRHRAGHAGAFALPRRGCRRGEGGRTRNGDASYTLDAASVAAEPTLSLQLAELGGRAPRRR